MKDDRYLQRRSDRPRRVVTPKNGQSEPLPRIEPDGSAHTGQTNGAFGSYVNELLKTRKDA